jgi:hypothetical protein
MTKLILRLENNCGKSEDKFVLSYKNESFGVFESEFSSAGIDMSQKDYLYEIEWTGTIYYEEEDTNVSHYISHLNTGIGDHSFISFKYNCIKLNNGMMLYVGKKPNNRFGCKYIIVPKSD